MNDDAILRSDSELGERSAHRHPAALHGLSPGTSPQPSASPLFQELKNDRSSLANRLTHEIASFISFNRLSDLPITPQEPLIEGFIYRNTVGGITGPAGSCKTFLAVSMAGSIASGIPWMGRKVARGVVFYITGEGAHGLRKRLSGWCSHYNVDQSLPVLIADRLPPLCDLASANALTEAICHEASKAYKRDALEPMLVIIDTLALAMAGTDENNAADIAKIRQSIQHLQNVACCAVQIIHHTGHSKSQRARGSSAYSAWLDSEHLVKSHGDVVTIKAIKARDWELASDINLYRHVVTTHTNGTDEPTLILSDTPARAASQTERDRHAVYDAKDRGLSVRRTVADTGISKSRVERFLKERMQPDMSGETL
ncbi:MAG: AAA family ATPase [Sphingomonadales bacterium]|nr:MAG: AAA family ATPase [Sphingomonadales bacterium]